MMAHVKGARGGRKSRSRINVNSRAGVPAVYSDMLAEIVSTPSQLSDDGKPVKKRRVAGRIVLQGDNTTASLPSSNQKVKAVDEKKIDQSVYDQTMARQPAIYQESEDSEDSESDMDWEEIEIADTSNQTDPLENDSNLTGELNLVLDGDVHANQGRRALKRRSITSAERNLRLRLHKVHLLALLVHVHSRNHWCNDENVHAKLRSFLSSRTVSCLNPHEKNSQFERSRSLIDGLSQASEDFRSKFKIVSRGISQPFWAENPEALANIVLPKDLELPIQLEDFRFIANKLEGSRDIGAQIFCALLRAVGVTTRLVCSLQPLAFTANSKGTNPQNPNSLTVTANPRSGTASSNDESEVETKSKESPSPIKPIGSVGGRSRFNPFPTSNLGQSFPNKGTDTSKPNVLSSRNDLKGIIESPFPVYWVEAFNEAAQKWIPVDPLTTKTVSKPLELEPTLGDSQNKLSYVLAFEEDGSARDVTRRYARAYNAKTRKLRVEATEGGEKWWRQVLKTYRRSYGLPRDQIEDTALAAREAAEGMPKNVMDFKDHPYYALERHLKRSEVIYPKREVGKVGVGRKGRYQILEPIFRRRDVHVVKSADSWYRQGREIKIGEQPLKYSPARRDGKESKLDDEDKQQSGDESSASIALYAAYQTVTYSAPPVVHGRIPKNVYGNLDIYVPSMVPPGGTHIRHPETAHAARILGIDYADAVTGFTFRGRHGTAIITGAVVATACCEAVFDVISGLEDDAMQQEEVRRSVEALRMWRRFLNGLKVKARIEGYEIEGEREANDKRLMNREEVEHDDDGSGFLPDAEDRSDVEFSATEGGGFFPEVKQGDGFRGGGFVLSDEEDRVRNDVSYLGENAKRSNLRPFGYDREGRISAESRFDNSRLAEEQLWSSNDVLSKGISDSQLNFRERFRNDIAEGRSNDSAPMKPRPQIQAIAQNEDRKTLLENPNIDNMSEDDPNLAGGFIRVPNDNEASFSQNYDAEFKSFHTPIASQPTLPDDELDEALMLQQLHESENAQKPVTKDPENSSSSNSLLPPNSSTTIEATSHVLQNTTESLPQPQAQGDNEDDSNKPLKKDDKPNPQLTTLSAKNPDAGAETDLTTSVNSDDEDIGSLLSHDPEDEDADPEWLA